MSLRQFFVCGQWVPGEGATQSVDDVIKFMNTAPVDKLAEVVVTPPSEHLQYMASQLTKPNVTVAADLSSIALQATVSPQKVKESGSQWVIVGQRSSKLAEGQSYQTIGEEIRVAMETGLKVMVCIADTLKEKEMALSQDVLCRQLACIADVVEDWGRVVVVYVPVWTLGTCKTIMPREVQLVHRDLRQWLANHVSPHVAKHARIAYGGQVTGNNCHELVTKQDVDGFLVYSDSISYDFLRVVNARR